MPSPAAPTPLCGWEEAIERLRNSEPKIYQQLHEMLSLTSPLNQSVSSTSPLITDDVCDDSDDSDDSNLPDRIAQLIQSSMTRLQKKDHSQTKSRKALERILRAVRLFQEVGTAAASVDPIHVGIPWAGVNLVLGTVLSDTEQNAAALQGLAEIAPLITRYAKVELCYWTENQRKKDTADKFEQDFRALLVELYVKILVYEMSIVAHCRRGRLGGIFR
ncbi:uncharacterized protein BP01DRAFT_110544 [Aspergillus saccharolyticus JOP 1030-1]|uniref:NWD NACHT-NTPase N-terminal domain-containing protein n=1 Tax=Aspergillus saccharolyticus JOP 1030-1 TaxID=1450539 RepID=A0A318ZX85_9EURO|nr:hypothetical protein BP01DRAFT_110544 [Aspergillus saccharolyticus JOP 1030-1]PYH48700.1 hypothetical protein BP01DRAFT_110544 [Aspergillus saccharolyticus JOP 1030-1]